MTGSTRDQQTSRAAQQGVPAPRRPAETSAPPSAWTGWIVCAAAMLLLVGTFQIVMGLVALLDDGVLLVRPTGLVVEVDYAVWGWAHLIVGTLACLVAAGLMVGNVVARVVGVLLVGASALLNLVFIPAYPLWSTVVIAIDVLIIYAIVVHGDEQRARW